MMQHKLMFFVVAAIALATVGDAAGRQAPPSGDATIDAATRAKVIDGALAQLQTAYVFPEVAQKMKDAINARVARKEYDSVVSARTFVELLTKHLQEVSNDKHLRVMYFEEPMPDRRTPTPEERARGLAEERRRNFGIDRAERLDGNIGYLELRSFSGSPEAGDTATGGNELSCGHGCSHHRSQAQRRRVAGHDRSDIKLSLRRCRPFERLLLERK